MAETSLYDDDIYAWSRQQAEALRALAQSELDLPNELDLVHIAEEVEDMGKAALNAACSAIRLIFIHLIKIAADPEAPVIPHWRGEIANFHYDLSRNYSPSMRQRIDLDDLWSLATRDAGISLHDFNRALPRGVPVECPYSLVDLLARDLDSNALLAKLQATIALAQAARRE